MTPEPTERQCPRQCPHPDAHLVPQEYGGVHIDVCSRCRGIWLDAGELEQLLGRGEPTLVSKALGEMLHAIRNTRFGG